jgi:OPA family sugar phosphate sensor protein UhpC-like MFS transporter
VIQIGLKTVRELNLFGKILTLLKAPPAKEAIEDAEEVKSQFKYWQFRIFYSIYFGYAFYYFTRRTLSSATNLMMTDLGVSMTMIGYLNTTLAISYGISKFASGVAGDRSNARYFMSFGLIMTGVANILFGLSSTFYMFAVFWAMNGIFQGFGWPPSARLMTHWYSKKKRGTVWGVWSTAHCLGGALIPIFASWCAAQFGWRYAMFIPGWLCIGVGLLLMNRLRDTPQSLGLPPPEAVKRLDTGKYEKHEIERELTAKERLFKYVLSNKAIWLLGVSYFFVYVVRQGIADWGQVYLTREKGYADVVAGQCIFWFETGGFVSMLVCGWASDKIFKGRRGPLCIICSFCVIFPIYFFSQSAPESVILDSIYMFLIGTFIFAPQMLVGLFAAELAHKKAAATATGFVGFFAYLGAAFAGGPLAQITEAYGWNGCFTILGISGLIATLLFIPIGNRGKSH